MKMKCVVMVTVMTLTTLLIVAPASLRSEWIIIPSAKAQVTILPGTEPEKPGQNNNPSTGSAAPPSPPPPATSPQGPGFSAKDIAETNSFKADADVKNLVILMPDKKLVDQDFLPLDTTIVKGTKVIWVNGDRSANHGVVVQDKSGQSVFSNQTIPFKNGTEFSFDINGAYTFSDPQSPSATKGTINVVDLQNIQDSSSTNSTMPTAGLFLVPAGDKSYFDKHFSTLGYHVADSTVIKQTGTTQGNDIALYVYTQKSGKNETIVHRTAVKIGFLESKLGKL
jgi:plastocyanin